MISIPNPPPCIPGFAKLSLPAFRFDNVGPFPDIFDNVGPSFKPSKPPDIPTEAFVFTSGFGSSTTGFSSLG